MKILESLLVKIFVRRGRRGVPGVLMICELPARSIVRLLKTEGPVLLRELAL